MSARFRHLTREEIREDVARERYATLIAQAVARGEIPPDQEAELRMLININRVSPVRLLADLQELWDIRPDHTITTESFPF